MTEDIKSTILFHKAYGTLIGGLIGDAIGTPSEGMSDTQIDAKFGWIDDFEHDGTDDTIMKHLLAEALIRTDGEATYDDWAAMWLEKWGEIFGEKVGKFFQSVLHTAAKLRHGHLPRTVALGNMPSSSSAMSIAPVGIVNACNPRMAAQQAYNIASLIHIHDVSFCQDGAAAIAAAVAAAFESGATVETIVSAAKNGIAPLSGQEMLQLIGSALEVADQSADFLTFRSTIYARKEAFFREIICDSRETIPLTLALFKLADGDFEKMVLYGANFGRDSDTIATMGGAIAGAFHGVDQIRADWVEKAARNAKVDQLELAEKLAYTAMAKMVAQQQAHQKLAQVLHIPQ